MKKNALIMLTMAFVLCVTMGSLQAASVTMLPAVQDVNQGGPFSIDLAYDFTDGILGGGIDISFDDTALNYLSFSWDPTFLTKIDLGFSSAPVDNSTGVIGALDGWNFGNFAGIFGTGTIGSINFEVDSLAALGNTFIAMAESVSSGGWFDAVTFGQITPTLTGANVNVNVVPIPGTLLLLGSGLIGLVGLGRSRRS